MTMPVAQVGLSASCVLVVFRDPFELPLLVRLEMMLSVFSIRTGTDHRGNDEREVVHPPTHEGATCLQGKRGGRFITAEVPHGSRDPDYTCLAAHPHSMRDGLTLNIGTPDAWEVDPRATAAGSARHLSR